MRLNKAKTEELAKLISDYRALAGQLSNTVFNVMQKPQLMDERAKESSKQLVRSFDALDSRMFDSLQDAGLYKPRG